MNEREWLACDDQEEMLAFLDGRASDRKALLFACACCRRIWKYLPNEEARRFVQATERRADEAQLPDDETAEDDFSFAAIDRSGGHDDYVYAYAISAVEQLGHNRGLSAAFGAAHGASYAETTATGTLAQSARSRTQVRLRALADLIREIFGNPFRPVVLNPAWLTSDVHLLASGIYDDRAFARMPILADALQDAGCDNEDVLKHCRDANATHVRGCWVVDLLVGKQ